MYLTSYLMTQVPAERDYLICTNTPLGRTKGLNCQAVHKRSKADKGRSYSVKNLPSSDDHNVESDRSQNGRKWTFYFLIARSRLSAIECPDAANCTSLAGKLVLPRSQPGERPGRSVSQGRRLRRIPAPLRSSLRVECHTGARLVLDAQPLSPGALAARQLSPTRHIPHND